MSTATALNTEHRGSRRNARCVGPRSARFFVVIYVTYQFMHPRGFPPRMSSSRTPTRPSRWLWSPWPRRLPVLLGGLDLSVGA